MTPAALAGLPVYDDAYARFVRATRRLLAAHERRTKGDITVEHMPRMHNDGTPIVIKPPTPQGPYTFRYYHGRYHIMLGTVTIHHATSEQLAREWCERANANAAKRKAERELAAA